MKKYISINCDFQISENCDNESKKLLKETIKNKKRNAGQYICLSCSRKLKASGRNNPNCKYKTLNDNFFNQPNTEEKAYILGFIAGDGHLGQDGKVLIQIHKKDILLLTQIRNIICKEIPIIKRKHNMIELSICSTQIVDNICSWLGISPGKRSDIILFPNFQEENLKWAFLRGLFDADGSINKPSDKNRYPICNISSTSANLLSSIKNIDHMPNCSISSNKISWSSTNAFDFLGKLYGNSEIHLQRKYDLYLDWSTWVPPLSGNDNRGKTNDIFRWNKIDSRAIAPSKTNVSDSGYDLTLIDIKKQIGEVILYRTGIKIQPIQGIYFDLVPRSSIIKSGYMLANSIGIIDQGYIGEVFVPLIKIDKSKPDLELPNKIVQLIPRPIIHIKWKQVDNLEETERGEGGFGSTSIK